MVRARVVDARGGRPRLPPGKVRRRSVMLKLTDGELRAVRRAVRELGKGKGGERPSVAGWFRDRGLKGLVSS